MKPPVLILKGIEFDGVKPSRYPDISDTLNKDRGQSAVEFSVDIADMDRGLDLYGTAVYCAPCGKAIREERPAGNIY